MSEFVRVAAVAELSPGRCREVSVAGKPAALYNVDGTFFATSNTCLHRGGPLGQGDLDGSIVICPWHAWGFDVTTGQSETDPELKLGTYEVKVEAGQVMVKVG